MNPKLRLATALLLTASAAAPADEAAPLNGPVRAGWYVAPMFTYLFPESTRYTGQGKGAIVAFGHHAQVASVEAAFLYYGGFKYDDEPRYGGQPQLLGGQLSLVLGVPAQHEVLSRFFGLVGFGGFKESNIPGRAQDGAGLIGDAGVGYLHPLELFGIDALLRTEVRYRADYEMPPREDWEPAYIRDWMVNVGLQIPLSSKPPEPPPPEPPRVVPPVEPTAQPNESTAQPAAESGAPAPAESTPSAPPSPQP